MRQLSEESGVAKATLYHHFRDKQDIYLNVIEREMIATTEQLDAAGREPGDIEARLGAVVRVYFEIMRARRSVIVTRLRETSGMEEAMQALICKHRDLLMAPFTRLVEEGIASGRFRALHVEWAVMSLLGMMNSLVTHRLLLDGDDITEEMEQHTLQLFLRGLYSDGVRVGSAVDG